MTLRLKPSYMEWKPNELADALEEWVSPRTVEQAATMLRQQQAELDAFKLNYYNTGYSLQLRDKDETIRQQQAEIKQLQDRLNEFLVGGDLAKVSSEK